jgi:hypothetical protein
MLATGLALKRLTCEPLYAKAFARELAALTLNLAAALPLESFQVIGERAVIAVAPVELQRVPNYKATPCKIAEFLLGEKERVR